MKSPPLERNQHHHAVSAMAAMTLESKSKSAAMLLSSDSMKEVVASNVEDTPDDAEIQEHVHTQSELTEHNLSEHAHLQSYYQPSPPMFVHSLSIDRSSPSSLLL